MAKQIIVHAPRDVRVDEIPPITRPLGDYELLVHTEVSAMSPGTETRIYTGLEAPRFGGPIPYDPFEPADFYNRSLSYIAVSWMPADDYPPEYQRFTVKRMYRYILDLMSRGRINLSPVVTHRFPVGPSYTARGQLRAGAMLVMVESSGSHMLGGNEDRRRSS
jgi:hypothetical protein